MWVNINTESKRIRDIKQYSTFPGSQPSVNFPVTFKFPSFFSLPIYDPINLHKCFQINCWFSLNKDWLKIETIFSAESSLNISWKTQLYYDRVIHLLHLIKKWTIKYKNKLEFDQDLRRKILTALIQTLSTLKPQYNMIFKNEWNYT